MKLLSVKLLMVLILNLLGASVSSAAAQGSGIPAELVGRWGRGSASISAEKNLTTGAISSKYGSSINYTFDADGTYSYAGLMQSTIYGCTTSLWNDQRGHITIEGDVITFTPTKDYWLNTNSCYPSANKEKNKDLEVQSYNYEVGERQGKTWLCMREVGKTELKDITCYPRNND